MTRFAFPCCFVLHCVVYSPGVSAQAPVPFYPDKTRLLFYLDEAGDEQAITTPRLWLVRRDHILASMQQVMGHLPGDERRAPLEVVIHDTTAGEAFTRHSLSYAAEPGDRVPAYLLIPNELSAPAAAVLCLHQTTRIGKDEPAGLGGLPNLHYAAELARRGFVTMCVDYPNFGTYEFDPYAHGYASATMKGIWNHMRAVDVLCERTEVDAERIGVIGHSLGGHNSLFVAAFDERIRCIATSCGFNSFAHYYKGDLTGWSHDGYMPRIRQQYDRDPAKMPFDFTEVLAALAPRPVFINAPLGDGNFAVEGVRVCVRAAAPVYALHHAKERLRAVYPDVGHDFPPNVREESYRWFERWLGEP